MTRSAARTRESDHRENRKTKRSPSDRPPRFALLDRRCHVKSSRTLPDFFEKTCPRFCRVPKSLRKQSSAVESRLLCCRSFVTDGDLGRLHPSRERGDNGREPRSGDRQAATDRTHPSPSSPPPSSAARTCLPWRKFSGLCHSRIRRRGKVGGGKGDRMIVVSVQAAGLKR